MKAACFAMPPLYLVFPRMLYLEEEERTASLPWMWSDSNVVWPKIQFLSPRSVSVATLRINCLSSGCGGWRLQHHHISTVPVSKETTHRESLLSNLSFFFFFVYFNLFCILKKKRNQILNRCFLRCCCCCCWGMFFIIFP